MKRYIVATGNGASDSIEIPATSHSLIVTAANWGSQKATLQVYAPFAKKWVDLQIGDDPVEFTDDNATYLVTGGIYRLFVASYGSPITMETVVS